MIRGRGNILEIPVDDAVVVKVLHAGQDGTGDKTMPISLSLPSPGEEQSDVPKLCHGCKSATEVDVHLVPRNDRAG